MSSLTHRQLRRAFASSRVTVPAQGCHRSAGSANRTRTAQLPAWCRMSPRTTARSGTEPTVSWTITWVDDEEPARMGRTGEQRGRRVDTEPPGCFHFGNSPPVTHAATSILTNGSRPLSTVTQIKRAALLPQSSPPPLGHPSSPPRSQTAPRTCDAHEGASDPRPPGTAGAPCGRDPEPPPGHHHPS